MSNIIQRVNGATVELNETVLAQDVWEPMFFRYWQLLNVTIRFIPIIIVISMFWLIYDYLKNLSNKNSLESKKSLENK